MNPIPAEVWDRGLAYGEYRDRIASNHEAFDEAWASSAYGPEDLDLLRRLPPLKVLAIGEDWCPDVYHTLPIWARLAGELPGWSLKVFPRDEHPDVMGHFLWKGGALRIPVYAFYDQRDFLQTWWSGRSAPAQRALDEALAGRSFGELSKEEQRRVGEFLEEGYRRGFRRANFEEILAQLRAFFHL